MRFKAALIIIVIAFAITAINFGSSLFLTGNTLNATMSEDISLALDIVNDFVSMRIGLYKSNARTAAERLMKTENLEDMETVMRELLDEFQDFMAFTVIDRQGILAEYGDSPVSKNFLDHSKYIDNAFDGQTVISTTRYNEVTEKLVMQICTPMNPGRVLSVTISGMIFSELFGNYILRDTRSIFMLDEYGTVIAHFLPELVTSRFNFTNTYTSPQPQASMAFFSDMLLNDRGLGNYSSGGVEYQCAYAKIYASETGWYIVLSVPMSENLMDKLRNRLMVLAVIFFAVGAVTAVVFSGQIAKPYNKIAEQNRRLEELNEITRSQTEKILEAHRLSKLMMDAMPICSMLWDRNCGIFDCNEETVKTFGMKDKQDFLSNFFLLSPEYQSDGRLSRDLAFSLINKTFEEGRFYSEWMHQLPDGTPVPCHITFVRVSKDDDYIVAAYARDLREHNRMTGETLRLQVELEAALKEAQDANRAKSSFLANMSHEMRTPLNAVVGLSELILNTGISSQKTVWREAEDKLGKIYTSGMTLLGIVNNILDISKIESGKFELHPIKYSASSLINDIVSQNIVRIGDKPVKFILTVDENLPEHLFGDDLRIKQIFNNLLSNAFKYTNYGTVEWKVSFEHDGDNIWLISSVKDTGMGIRNEDMPKLFKDYSQLNPQTFRKTESTGLGLSITKHLVEMMDGTITVDSEYGKGMTFSVRLRQKFVSVIPIGKETVANIMSARFHDNKYDESARLVKADLSYACVLVVDDIPTNLDVAKGMLMPYRLRVDCASGGQQAIDMIRAENPRYDLVFMDHMMPGIDGIEALRIIREEIGSDYAKNVPVIVLTANAIAGNEKMFMERGFQAFISKPIDRKRLDSFLRRWIKTKNAAEKKDAIVEMEFVKNPYFSNEKNISAKQNSQLMLPLSGITIDSVNIDSGLEYFLGNEEMYIKVLRSYMENTRPLIDIIKKYLECGNLKDYAVTVHGIKGSSFSIGAMNAGYDSERLERLAKKGKTDQVLAENGAFIESIENLLDSIENALAMIDGKIRKPVAASPDPVILQELRDACVEYDIGRVDKVMEKLESFEYENGEELIAWLHRQVDDMSFSLISDGKWPVI